MSIFIPIKEQSQRVPNKNFRILGEMPLYERCLLKLKDHKVFVDTDSDILIDNIKSNPLLAHVTAYSRREDLRGHDVSVCDLIENFIVNFKLTNEVICQLHVTSPFLTELTINKAISLMKEGYDSVVACNLYQNRLWRREQYGYCPINHNPCKLEQTQDLPVYYEENSLFYIFNSDDFLKTKLRIGTNPHFYPCSFPENLDIDNEDDWNLCDTLVTGGMIK